MASGTITGTTGNEFIDSKIEWSSKADTANNHSHVTAKLYYKRNNEYTGATYGTGSYSLTINGEKTSKSGVYLEIYNTDWVLALTATATVPHNSDGSKTITISAAGGIPGLSFDSTNCSGTANLDTIARASAITSAANVTLGNKCSVKWTPASASFRYKLKFSLGSWSYTTGAIHPNKTSAYTYTGYTIPLAVTEEIEKTTGTMTVTLYTYSNSGATTQVGSADSETFTVTVPNNSSTKPKLEHTVTPVNSLPSPFGSMWVHGKTKAKFTITAEGKYGATITSRYIKYNGVTYDADDDFTTDYLRYTGSGLATVDLYVKDSRGFVTEGQANIFVEPYSKPQLLPVSGEREVICTRCDADGNLDDSGTSLRIKAKRSYTTLGGENQCQIRYRHKVSSASSYSSWSTILAKDDLSTHETDVVVLGDTLLADNSYMVQVQVIDDLGEHSYITFTIPTDSVFCHRDGAKNSITFGGYVEENNTFAIGAGMEFKVKSEKWVSLGLSSEVSESDTNTGRNGKGCYYRIVNGNHVYVAFNCALAYAGAAVTVSGTQIPAKYRPKLNAYALCATNGRGIARVFVNTSGDVRVDHVQNSAAGETTSAYTVSWIDGYIDYFV